MKTLSNPTSVAVDSVAIFAGMIGWMFMTWAPFFLGFILLFVAKPPAPAALIIFLFVMAILFPLGLLLRWLSKGLILRARFRILLFMFLLGVLSYALGFAPLLTKAKSGTMPLDRWLMGAALLSAAMVSALGLSKGARVTDD